MSGKTLIETQNPVTQSLGAIKAFLVWKGRAVDPMPSTIEFMQKEGRLVLVLSNKKYSYYVTTATKCSCPAATYHPGQSCKHQRKHFPQEQVAKSADEPLIQRGGFKPFALLPSEEKAMEAV
jgi:hypothetical protein